MTYYFPSQMYSLVTTGAWTTCPYEHTGRVTCSLLVQPLPNLSQDQGPMMNNLQVSPRHLKVNQNISNQLEITEAAGSTVLLNSS